MRMDDESQIETAGAVVRYVQRGGKIWIRVFPDKPITNRPRSNHGWRKGSCGVVFPVRRDALI